MQRYKKLYLAIHLFILFCFLLFINLFYLEGIAHVPDSAAYVFIAKMIANGHFIARIPVSPQHFDFFPGVLTVDSGSWLFQYPLGHPLLLAIGQLINFPNIIPPLIGAFCVLLLFLIAKKVFPDKTYIFVLFLPFFSPFFLENASEFMSHNSAAFYLLLSLYFLILSINGERKIFYSMCSGLALGFLLNTRPLTCAPFLFLFCAVIFIRERREKLNSLFAFLIGFFLLIGLWLYYNFITTGSITSSQYFIVNKYLFFDMGSIKFLLTQGFYNAAELFRDFSSMAFDWPAIITYLFILLSFLIGKPNFWAFAFFLFLFTLPLAYFFYDGTFIMYGPRFWYEILPFVFLLTARSFAQLYELRKKTTVSMFIIMGSFAISRLFSLLPSQDETYFSPLQLRDLRGFNYVDARIENSIKSSSVKNAVIFVKDCNGNWWCFGSVLDQNSPSLNTDIVFAKDLGKDTNQVIKDYYPSKKYYAYDYDKKELSKAP